MASGRHQRRAAEARARLATGWQEITVIGSRYECEVYWNAGKTPAFRHRKYDGTGWRDGLAPDMIDTVTGSPRFQWVPEGYK